jgi:hypothetical protein
VRIGRSIVIPAILMLAVAGSAAAASATPAVVLAQAPAHAVSGLYYHS